VVCEVCGQEVSCSLDGHFLCQHHAWQTWNGLAKVNCAASQVDPIIKALKNAHKDARAA
jgi:hypothetical protein